MSHNKQTSSDEKLIRTGATMIAWGLGLICSVLALKEPLKPNGQASQRAGSLALATFAFGGVGFLALEPILAANAQPSTQPGSHLHSSPSN
ncbi:MAG TPA: hypothetical protein V6C81_21530 [Planktothrix sp.]